MTEAGVPSDYTTISAILDDLRDAGFDGNMTVEDDGRLRCGSCHDTFEPSHADLDVLRRVEGASDPADMAAVLGLRCQVCGALGAAVVRYGPEAGPGDERILLSIEDHRRDHAAQAADGHGEAPRARNSDTGGDSDVGG